jgi:hypothetical protein
MLGFRTGFSSRGRGSAAAALDLDLRFAGGTKAAAAVAPPMPSPDASVLALRFFAIGWTPGDPPAAGVPSYSAVRRDPCRPPPRRPARAPFVPARPPGAPPRQRPMPQRRTLFLGVRQRNGEVSSLKLRSQIAPLETQRANLEGQFRRGTRSMQPPRKREKTAETKSTCQ